MSEKLQFVAGHDKLKAYRTSMGFVIEPSRNHPSPQHQSLPIPVGCDYHGLGVK
jgi:hypothetical protein